MSAKRPLPMPCPACKRMIDAADRHCPYCGVDTDKVLWPLRVALPLMLVAALALFYLLRR